MNTNKKMENQEYKGKYIKEKRIFENWKIPIFILINLKTVEEKEEEAGLAWIFWTYIARIGLQ
jgi:hypothetical protein